MKTFEEKKIDKILGHVWPAKCKFVFSGVGVYSIPINTLSNSAVDLKADSCFTRKLFTAI